MPSKCSRGAREAGRATPSRVQMLSKRLINSTSSGGAESHCCGDNWGGRPAREGRLLRTNKTVTPSTRAKRSKLKWRPATHTERKRALNCSQIQSEERRVG